MSKETVREILEQDFCMRKLAVKLNGGRKGQMPNFLQTSWNNFKKIIFWIVSSLVMSHGVKSMIPRPNASPEGGDQRIPQGQKSQGFCNARLKQC
jgi:hypothetical protein